MAQVAIEIGGRVFDVACQEGEEHYLQTAAALLDAEAQALLEQIGRLPEARLLLMSGLMLADKTAGVNEDLERTRAELEEAKARIAELENAPPPAPERIEVPVIPQAVTERLAELTARAESLADQLDERAAAG